MRGRRGAAGRPSLSLEGPAPLPHEEGNGAHRGDGPCESGSTARPKGGAWGEGRGWLDPVPIRPTYPLPLSIGPFSKCPAQAVTGIAPAVKEMPWIRMEDARVLVPTDAACMLKEHHQEIIYGVMWTWAVTPQAHCGSTTARLQMPRCRATCVCAPTNDKS